ncbi:Gmc2p SCDLUD_004343 [Saccharomycodes ludwigii]|uniref:Gmc2p n=1 Tax=Saccharomycodes ludwigii TaxID=36035 RepID=UPI001E8AA66E|nr:hypothetical protein SCDLUD_004343 [Saccharomycodes ludwigii]KAH3900026.1 hypothetical protein SCDLUD_004343 [Saccharomycodes ludwigii]
MVETLANSEFSLSIEDSRTKEVDIKKETTANAKSGGSNTQENKSENSSNLEDQNKNDIGNDLASEFVNSAEYQLLKQEMLKQKVLCNLKESTGILQNASAIDVNGKLPKINWDDIYNMSANVMEIYTKEVDELLGEMDKLFKQQFIWQEAAFTTDSHRGAKRMSQVEKWICDKENYIEYIEYEFKESAATIKNVIESLSK